MNKLVSPPGTDKRIAYGRYCTWWGPVANLSITGKCPFCGKDAEIMADENAWMSRVAQYALEKRDASYAAFIMWLKDRQCRPVGGRVNGHRERREMFERMSAKVKE